MAMSCWPFSCLCGLKLKFQQDLPQGSIVVSAPLAEEAAALQDEGGTVDGTADWFFQGSQEEPLVKKVVEPLLVRAMSGASVASLSPRNTEKAAALKMRIHKQEGTAVFMQKLVQDGRVLADADIVSKEPLVLVRMPRKRILLASVHSDLRSYDLETGAAMQVLPSLNLRLSCMVADWENARCFTGSADGVVRVWDVYSNLVLGTMPGPRTCKVSAIASDLGNRLLAAYECGSFRIWDLEEKGSGEVIAAMSEDFQIDVSGHVAVAVDWQRSLAVVTGENKDWGHTVLAYDLQTHNCLWSYQLPGATPSLVVDWDTGRCVIAPGRSWLELRGVEAKSHMIPKRFAHDRLHHKALFSVNWPTDVVVFVAKPFALELVSLSTFEILHKMVDWSGDYADIISLNVDWSASVPRAITCRTYIDWELVVGEVCIQDWDIQEGGDFSKVQASHPLIGGFDIVGAIAQF